MRMKRVVMGAVVGVAAMGTWGLWPGRRLVMEGGGVNGGRTMRVHLVDETTGLAVAGARVTANEPGEWRTGADGAAVIGRPAGEPVVWTVYVEAAGYLRQEVEWFDNNRIAGLPEGVEVRVGRGQQVGGRVVDESGKPVAGARVALAGRAALVDADDPLRLRPPMQVRQVAPEAKTDAEGMWHAAVPVGGGSHAYWVTVHGDGWYAPGAILPVNEATVEMLKRGEWQTVVKRAGRVEVTAVRADGRPAAGARVHVAGEGETSAEAETGADGQAVLSDVPPGEVQVMVECADQMAQVVKGHVGAGATVAERVELKAAAPLRGQVVDADGKAIAGVRVMAVWQGSTWQQFTDEEGRFAWAGAPGERVQMAVIPTVQSPPAGFVAMKAGEENRVVCGRVTHVAVTATDAVTGKALKRVQAVEVSDPQRYGMARSDVAEGADGKVDAWLFGRGTHWLRISAPGHYAATVGPYDEEAGEVRVAAALKPGQGVKGVVVGPEGGVVADAVVAQAAMPRGDLQILDGRVYREPVVRGEKGGHFELPPREKGGWVWVSAAEGYAWVAEETATEVHLRPWAKVTLQVARDGKPLRGGMVAEWTGTMAGAHFLGMNWRDVWTDAEGRATLERVPEGKVSVDMGQVEAPGQGAGGGRMRYGEAITVAAGKTTEVEWMGGGVMTGRVVVPAAVGKGWTAMESVLVQEGPAMVVPEGFNGWSEETKEGWLAAHPEAARGAGEGRHAYRGSVNVDGEGRFRVTDVPAGTYTLRVRVGVPRAAGEVLAAEGEERRAEGEVLCHLVVGGEGATVDVGELAMGPVRQVAAGEAAPGFAAVGLKGGVVRLSDLRGKWVVVDCWATWCGPCVEETPNLRAVEKAFGKQGLVMVGVDFDEDLDKARAYVAREGLEGEGWRQAMAAGWARGEMESYAGGLPQIVLIDPEGKVAVRALRGAGMVEKVGAAMRGEKK